VTLSRLFLKCLFSCRAWQIKQSGVAASESLLEIAVPQRRQVVATLFLPDFLESLVTGNSLPFARSPLVSKESAARSSARTINSCAYASKLA
jgi:hypothetical protein